VRKVVQHRGFQFVFIHWIFLRAGSAGKRALRQDQNEGEREQGAHQDGKQLAPRSVAWFPP
jgi:hypothetical protein